VRRGRRCRWSPPISTSSHNSAQRALEERGWRSVRECTAGAGLEWPMRSGGMRVRRHRQRRAIPTCSSRRCAMAIGCMRTSATERSRYHRTGGRGLRRPLLRRRVFDYDGDGLLDLFVTMWVCTPATRGVRGATNVGLSDAFMATSTPSAPKRESLPQFGRPPLQGRHARSRAGWI